MYYTTNLLELTDKCNELYATGAELSGATWQGKQWHSYNGARECIAYEKHYEYMQGNNLFISEEEKQECNRLCSIFSPTLEKLI